MKSYLSNDFSDLRTEFIDGHVWKLIDSLSFKTKESEVITAPQDFVTDFASIPRAGWTLVGHPAGEYCPAAVIHDYLYLIQIFSREKSDKIFLEGMESLKVAWWKRRLMWRAVRLVAWIRWNQYATRKINLAGYRKPF
jgi:hypothetical protein